MSEEVKGSSLEERIIDAAKSVFMEKGYTDACMSEIAERVGINRPGLHYYFRTKDKMFNAVFGMIVASVIPKFQDIITNRDLSLSVRVEQIVDVYYNLLQENPYLPLFMLREIDRDVDFLLKTYSDLKVEHFFAELKNYLLEEMDKGRLRRVPLRIVFLTFYSALTFPFVSRKLMRETMMEKGEDFRTVLDEWKPYIISQMVNLLSVDGN
ncbi:TetR/AcrR family transcriptional regulator [Phocaeicola sp. HCN-6420]|jgi:TetR/AcrR family transcriptional regulator|uniref:TetR/AcrR family transcriptional regulator n=1 Tax=Phocaeicola sp. HCN-6420 TaxID=3134673 RepID=UPI0030BB37B8